MRYSTRSVRSDTAREVGSSGVIGKSAGRSVALSAHRPASLRQIRIWHAVEQIPPGRVATYGDIARAAGIPRGARQVGRALRTCPQHLDLPWHRVLGAGGRIALPGDQGAEQRTRLRFEGVPFSGTRVLLDRCRWTGIEE